MLITSNYHVFPFQDRWQIVFQFQLTGFIKNDIVKIEILPLKKITASIRRRQNNWKKVCKKVNIFLNDLSQSQSFVIDTASFIIQIRNGHVFIILLKLLYRILLGNIPEKLHKTLLRNPQLFDFFTDFLIIFLTEIQFWIRIMIEQQRIISRIQRRFPIADRIQFFQNRLLKI
ncbi:hypothetical protein D3C87_996730 [compost metagenome]